MATMILCAAVGYVAGAFTPAVGRTIKAWFVKKSAVPVAAAEAAVGAEIKKVV